MTDEETPVEDRISALVLRFAQLDAAADALDPNTDLWDAGMSSMHSVSVMMAVEEEFGVEFTEGLLTRATFTSVASIARAVRKLRDSDPAVAR
ncbi:acyl carrier protein [Micromonospora sp. RP3T]|uniref:acyl carrier protein n=1 Tax=Micromonospora sp. RP3T TaxID=2135446 RepID=UPI001E63EF64|nr:acyl carrier protein [Micromonospora sp. RP3T]